MDATHHTHGETGYSHSHDDGHEHGQHEHHEYDEDWNDEDFVLGWLAQQKEREAERRRQFAVMRAFLPKTPEQEFRYLNLGAGGGSLDRVLLEHFHGANATLLDTSLVMLGVARKELSSFGNRVEYVQANLAGHDWAGALGGPFDLIVSTIALHNLEDAEKIRSLYAEAYKLLGHGGMILNLDYVRATSPGLMALAGWAAKDPEAALNGRGGRIGLPATMNEHLAWLHEAGFGNVDVLWKEGHVALVCGLRDHLHLPDADGHGHDSSHGHSH